MWDVLVSIAAGAGGYLAVTFWFQPVLRYRGIRSRVASDLVFYANAIELQKISGEIRPDTSARMDANRRHAADLKAIYSELPFWYSWWLKRGRRDPLGASCDLLELSTLSQASDRTRAKELMDDIRQRLGLPNAETRTRATAASI